MGALKNLEAMKKRMKEQDDKFQDFGPRVVWVKVDDGKSIRLRPLQELDESSPHYDKERGLAQMNVEHSNPANYQQKALCSIDSQGQCFGCEQDWPQSLRLYMNVEVQGEEPFVAVMNQGSGPKSATPTLISHAEEPDDDGNPGSITNKIFKLGRTGLKKKTTWLATFLKETKEDVPEYELFDLALIVREIPYDQQEAHYNYKWSKDKDEHESSGLDEFAKKDDDEKW